MHLSFPTAPPGFPDRPPDAPNRPPPDSPVFGQPDSQADGFMMGFSMFAGFIFVVLVAKIAEACRGCEPQSGGRSNASTNTPWQPQGQPTEATLLLSAEPPPPYDGGYNGHDGHHGHHGHHDPPMHDPAPAPAPDPPSAPDTGGGHHQ